MDQRAKIASSNSLSTANAPVFGVDCISDFNVPHSRKHDAVVRIYAFDLLALAATTREF
ncbi:hypothetical protein [Bradyrhizobium sp. WSM3983]|uniref:hypothetical protein n=1 Tax=Bradyrhizobium sp. WSM3983 TaxID=1038867 RepID=UPI0003FB3BA0|nr:hypothetical protein [Bradyrhizobium sp. WSM3983]